jgi:hypothetical protein
MRVNDPSPWIKGDKFYANKPCACCKKKNQIFTLLRTYNYTDIYLESIVYLEFVCDGCGLVPIYSIPVEEISIWFTRDIDTVKIVI